MLPQNKLVIPDPSSVNSMLASPGDSRNTPDRPVLLPQTYGVLSSLSLLVSVTAWTSARLHLSAPSLSCHGETPYSDDWLQPWVVGLGFRSVSRRPRLHKLSFAGFFVLGTSTPAWSEIIKLYWSSWLLPVRQSMEFGPRLANIYIRYNRVSLQVSDIKNLLV